MSEDSKEDLVKVLSEILTEFKDDDYEFPEGDLASLNMIEDLELDSLDIINFFFQVEEKFGVSVSAEDFTSENLNNLGNFATFIQSHQ